MSIVFWRSRSSTRVGTFHMTWASILALPPPGIHDQCSIEAIGRPCCISLMTLCLWQHRRPIKRLFKFNFSYTPSSESLRSIFLTVSLQIGRSLHMMTSTVTALVVVLAAPGTIFSSFCLRSWSSRRSYKFELFGILNKERRKLEH